MANDHDKFTCGCSDCNGKYRDYYADKNIKTNYGLTKKKRAKIKSKLSDYSEKELRKELESRSARTEKIKSLERELKLLKERY